MLMIGKSIETDDEIYLDSNRSRTMLICGKRGSGKSYTLGVLAEELFENKQGIVIIVDPMGIYHTMTLPNTEQEQRLWDWGMRAKELPVRLLVPGEPEHLYGDREIIQAMQSRGLEFVSIWLNPSDLTADGWCDLFDLTLSEPMGMVLYRAVQELHRRTRDMEKPFFNIPQIITQVDRDKRAQDKTVEALLLRLETAIDWGIFAEEYKPILELFRQDAVNVIDLSVIEAGRYGLRNLVLDVVCRNLFRKRTIERRREELNLSAGFPRIWLAIDEAQQFVPSSKKTLAKENLIRWVKEGRQPGLSLIAASQQPAAIDGEILSQCDVIIAHKITALEDMQALNKLNQDYMKRELQSLIRQIKKRGVAILVDDENESVNTVSIRPRKSHHGGSESQAVSSERFRI